MEVIDIPKPEKDINQVGGIWRIDVNILAASMSAAYLLPINPIYAIGLEWTGDKDDPIIEFSFNTRGEIIADTATWSIWNKVLSPNLAITAIRFTTEEALPATAKIIVKGFV